MSLAVMYNLLVVVARIVFTELQGDEWTIFWICCDLLSDFFYALDFLIHFRTGSYMASAPFSVMTLYVS